MGAICDVAHLQNRNGRRLGSLDTLPAEIYNVAIDTEYEK